MASEDRSYDRFKVNDRVKRSKARGCQGIVTSVRFETTSTTGDAKERGILISVNWDNGTVSYVGPDGLQKV